MKVTRDQLLFFPDFTHKFSLKMGPNPFLFPLETRENFITICAAAVRRNGVYMDAFFGLDREAPHGKDLTCFGTYYDNASLEVAQSVLREADIPFLCKDRGAGGAVRILAGYNMFGADLFVREEDAPAALELLAPAEGENRDEMATPEKPEGDI